MDKPEEKHLFFDQQTFNTLLNITLDRKKKRSHLISLFVNQEKEIVAVTHAEHDQKKPKNFEKAIYVGSTEQAILCHVPINKFERLFSNRRNRGDNFHIIKKRLNSNQTETIKKLEEIGCPPNKKHNFLLTLKS